MTLRPGLLIRYAVLFPLLLAPAACDPVTRHEVLVSVLDGYPSLPPAEELCREHEARALAACLKKETVARGPSLEATERSEHRPFREKRCNDCHVADKGSGAASEEGLLVKPREELCLLCHKNLLSKPFQHGPAAVGECLACHLPHDSQNPSLLVLNKDSLCLKCHVERRRASGMHDLFAQKGMACATCHDPHSGDSTFFLK